MTLALTAGAAPDGKYGLVFSLYPNQMSSESLWQEAMVGINVAGGMFSTQLGTNAKNPLTVPLFADNAELWQGVSIDGDPELSRVRLWSVPYALSAEYAKKLQCTGCVTGKMLADKAVTAAQLAKDAVITVHRQDKAITAPKIGSFAFPITAGPAFPCDAAHLGWAFIDKKDTVLYVCNGKDLRALSALVQVGTVSSPGAN
ncbi:MAG: hypothetical protein EXR79_11055 [Myxococcales bacterium]|nr:hypothetical protein [Myxococcales bacterium]